MRLLLFGRLRDIAEHLHDADVPLPGATLEEVIAWASGESATLADALARPGVRYVVDLSFVERSATVQPNSEVAFLSPLSGG